MNGLGGGRRHRSFLAPLFFGDFADAMAESNGSQPEKRKYGQGNQRELPIHVKHQCEHSRHNERLGDRWDERRDGHLLQHRHVADNPHDQIAGLRPGMKGEGKILDVAIQLGAHFAQDPIADLGEADRLPVGRQRAQPGNGHHRQGGEREREPGICSGEIRKELQPVPPAGAEDAIENELERPRFHQAEPYLSEKRQQGGGHQASVVPGVRPEVF